MANEYQPIVAQKSVGFCRIDELAITAFVLHSEE